MIASAGGKLIGFDFQPLDETHWASMTINVNISAPPGQPFQWGFLSTSPKNIRILKGPADTCEYVLTKSSPTYLLIVADSLHPWDAMILRDCTTNTSSLHAVSKVSRRKWDILLIKCCEDFDRKLHSVVHLCMSNSVQIPGLWLLSLMLDLSTPRPLIAALISLPAAAYSVADHDGLYAVLTRLGLLRWRLE